MIDSASGSTAPSSPARETGSSPRDVRQRGFDMLFSVLSQRSFDGGCRSRGFTKFLESGESLTAGPHALFRLSTNPPSLLFLVPGGPKGGSAPPPLLFPLFRSKKKNRALPFQL